MRHHPSARCLVALSLLAVAVSAHAQRAALTQDIDAGVRVPWRESANVSCRSAGYCFIAFSAVPAGHRREVQYASCRIATGVASSVYWVDMATTVGVGLGLQINLPISTAPGTNTSFIASAPVTAYYEAGETLYIESLASAPTYTLLCTLIGRQVAL